MPKEIINITPLEKKRKEIDLHESRSINIDGVETVCLALGPYRNLTTLTASILFLHPNCQVLNHGGSRILADERLNFLKNYNDEKFKAFTRYAIHISKSGRKGQYGGSITLSHAFKSGYPVKEVFQSSGMELVKNDIKCLFWKEPLRTTNCIRNNHVDLAAIFKRNKQLKFLMPIRNPLDCAVSNVRTGHSALFSGLSESNEVEAVLDAILDEYLWFEMLRNTYPDRFYLFFMHEFDRRLLKELAGFLKIEPCDNWCDKSLTAFDIKSHYIHSDDLKSFYRGTIKRKFIDHPDFARKLLCFSES
jgi:hypothetical protein